MLDEKFIDKLVLIVENIIRNEQTNSDKIAELIGLTKQSARLYLQKLIKLEIVVPRGANKNRTYRLRSGIV